MSAQIPDWQERGRGKLPYSSCCMSTLTAAAKGPVTPKRDWLQHLGIAPDDKITVDEMPDGRIQVAAATKNGKILDIFGMFGPTERLAPTIEELNEVIAAAWAGKR